MNALFDLISFRPFTVLLGVTLLSALAVFGLVDRGLRVDPTTGSLLAEEGPERETYELARKLFGTDESVVVALGADDVFTADVLRRVLELTRRLEAIDGVQGVLSLATARNVRSVGDNVIVGPVFKKLPESASELERIGRETFANPFYGGTLVSHDARATALVVSLDRMSDREYARRGIDDEIVEAARDVAGNLDVWVAGVPHQKYHTGRQLTREMSWMMPVVIALLGFVLLVSLRSVRGTVLILLTIVISAVWTLGTLAWLGVELNIVTIIVPVLILIIGFTYALHVVTDFYAELRGHEGLGSRNAVRKTLETVAVPVLVTGITTGAGFVSLALNRWIPAIQQFGLYSLLGVGFTLLASLTLVPAALALLPLPRRGLPVGRSTPLDRVADALGHFFISNRRATIGVAFAVLGVSLLGMTQIRVAIPFPGDMRPDHPIRRDYEQINERLGGAYQLRIVLQADEADGILEPPNLRAIRALQEWLDAQPEIGRTVSIVDYLMLLNRALHSDDPAHFAVPERRRLASQLLLFGASPEVSRFINARRRIGSVLVYTTVADSDRIRDLLDRIEVRLDELPEVLDGAVTGSAALLYRAVDGVSRGQLISITAAFGLIYLILALWFTSPRVGLIALFPNVLPIAVYFGALGLTGVTLNPSTSLVGALALGIAVDDTIHFFARFNVEAKRLADERAGARAALQALIRPVTFTTVGLVLGFLVLTTSDSSSQMQLGYLAALTIAAAWVSDVTVSPALCAGTRIVTLWDVLRLDLGEAPQRDIPLFEGLTLRQVRIFALMSDVRNVLAGERLITMGETGDDMFVILGGELLAWVPEGSAKKKLSTMQRGATVGETGYFTHERTAHVDVEKDALLIRFDSEDLENLRRRYPRTGAVVYRNLNRIQAERLHRTTGQLARALEELARAERRASAGER
jgi:predicted RND superfamily exporter protein/CRP-like cAMP-binding protein